LKEVAFDQSPVEDLPALLTANMFLPLNFLFSAQSMAVVATAVGSGNLSDAELLGRYPVIVTAGAVLLSLGLICDFYLLFRLTRSVAIREPTADESLLKIEPKPWGMDDLLFAIGALVLVWVVCEGTVLGAFKLTHVDQDGALPWLLFLEMLLRIVFLFGFVAVFRRRGIDWRQAVGLRRKPPLHAIAFGGIFFLAMLPPLAVVFPVCAELCRYLGIKDTPQDVADLLATSDSTLVVVLIIVFAIAVAPIFEEFFFRGFAYPALKQRWGTWRALVIVSAAFAAIHLHVPSLGPLFTLAIGLGLSYEFTGSLLAPITMHALFNAVNVGMLLYVRSQS
jgi:membrane protease YdiL (CAAX protease family)